MWVLLRSTSSLEGRSLCGYRSWILEAPSPYDRSGIVSRRTDLRYLYTCEDGVRLNYVLRPSHSDVRFGTITIGSKRKRSIVQSTCRTYRSTVRDTVGDPYAVPCRAVPRPRRAGLSTNRARCRSLPRRTGRGNSRSRRALRLSPSRGPPLLRGVRSYHCVPRAIAPSAGSDGTYT